ncbi:unnamed protein product [Rotaria socialis]|nr:unnamed protein product [Rotaria socialis]CAF3292209.1 unnamed protein product [Rotaria socialis]CAF4481465.1 unnamed protein product [Rotaria socialis]CAF4619352.1 unnamed protein product [Rotaria socialis]CAF4966918.1 unnamed protein product [Rotaria socialis]
MKIADILSAMPCLQRLALNLCTEDINLVTGHNLCRILPSTCVEIHLFIIDYFDSFNIKIGTLLSTWPNQMQVTRSLEKQNNDIVIHTIPCKLPSIIISSKIANGMLIGSKYTREVKALEIYGEHHLTDIHLIVQYFQRIRTPALGSNNDTEPRKYLA